MESKYLRLLSDEINRAKNDVVIKVLTDLLKRTPTEDDYKRVHIYHKLDELNSILTYNGMKLGVVKVKPDAVVFEPFEDGFLDNIIDENGKVNI